MAVIIDKRLNGRNKSSPNRERFIRRYKSTIREHVKDAIKNKNISDINKDTTNISVKRKDLTEPQFVPERNTGKRGVVHPGNKEFIKGQKIPKPQGGQGDGTGTEGSNDPTTSEDDFIFDLNKEEFLDILFEDCELPNMVHKSVKNATEFENRRAGYSTVGNPANLNVIKSIEKSIGRRVAMRSPMKSEIHDLEESQKGHEKGSPDWQELQLQIDALWKRVDAVPYIDEYDLRYNAHQKIPIPATSAAMFCLMDISASMGEHEKDLAKRFFYLLYLFLTRKYDKVEIVFISHHTSAKEVTEEEFFYSKETGGTVVSTALDEMQKIIKDRFAGNEWNIYGAQASDGDNWGSDNDTSLEILRNQIFPKVQHFAYIETQRGKNSPYGHSDHDTDLWGAYEKIVEPNFAMKKVNEPADIFPVFQELFGKE